VKHETKIAEIEVIEHGIIRVCIKPNVEIIAPNLDENAAIYKQILGEGKGLFLIVFEEGGTSDQETRDKYGDKSRSRFKLAEALVTKSLAHKIESKFYKNYYKPDHPVEIFTNEEKAKKWLLRFKQ
jgi:hypothetical protein